MTPHRCPKCPVKEYYGVLVKRGAEAPKCPNCGTQVVPVPQRA